jgi:uncharacterized protein (TIGR02099 family)
VNRLRLRLAHLLGALAAVLAALVLLLAVAVGLFRFASSAIPHARGAIETWSERRLGLELRLRTINLVWHRFHPEFVLTDVFLPAPKGGSSVTVRRLALGISWEGLAGGRLRPSWIALDGLSLPMVQNRAGHWRLPRALAPLLAAASSRHPTRPFAGRLRVRDARFLLRSPVLGPRPVLLLVRRFRLRSGDGRARFELEGRLPDWGRARLRLRYVARGRRAWRPWRRGTRWRLDWRLGGLHAGALLLALRPSWAALDPRGRLDGTGTLVGRGLVFNGRANLALEGFRWRGKKGLRPPVDLRFRSVIRSGDARTAVDVPELVIRSTPGPVPPPLAFRLTIHPTAAGTEVRARLPRLDFSDLHAPLAAVAAFAGGRGGTEFFVRADPHGRLLRARLVARWRRGRLAAWTVHGVIVGLRTREVSSVPGGALPPVRLALGNDGGGVVFAAGALDLSEARWGARTLAFTTPGFVLNYRRVPSGWKVDLPPLRIQGPGGRYAVRGTLRLVPKGVGRIRLALRAKRLVLPELRAALPASLLGKGFVRWFARALPKGGEIRGLTLRWHGPLVGVPYVHGGGLLVAQARARMPRLRFARRWPALRHVRLALSYQNGRFKAALSRGTFAGWSPSGAWLTTGPQARRGRLHLPLLGPAAVLVRALRRTPLVPTHGPLRRLRSGAGSVRGRLVIDVPFSRPQETELLGGLLLRNVSIGLGAKLETITSLMGPVRFAPGGVTTPGLQGRWLGTPLALRIVRRGSAERLEATGELPLAAFVADARGGAAPSWLGGTARWTLHGELLPHAVGRFVWRTDLRGAFLALHAPFGKPAAVVRPLVLEVRTRPGRTVLRGRYGHLVDGFLERTASSTAWSGAFAFGGGRPVLHAQGLVVEGDLPALDLRDLRRLLALGPRGRPPSPHVLPPALVVDDLRIGRVNGYGQDFGPLTLFGRLGTNRLRLRLTSAAVAGTIRYRRSARDPHGLVRLDFARLDLRLHRARASGRPSASASRAAPLRSAPPSPPPARATKAPDPGSFPALELQSLATRLGGADLGRVVARLRPAPHAWILSTLEAEGPGYRLQAHGYWARRDGLDRVRFLFTVTSRDVHTAFLAFGLTPLMTGQHAVVDGDLGWHGVPWRLDRPTLSGVLSLRARRGRILPLNPGLGRVIGLLSLNSLPERLGLDFGDVFDKGLTYNTVAGRFRIAHGIATVPALTLLGPAVNLRLEGRTNIVHETYDEVVRVVPLVGSTLPIAGAVAGGPVGFAALLVLSRLFSLPLRALLATYYHIGGTWTHPVVRRVSDEVARRLGFRASPRP